MSSLIQRIRSFFTNHLRDNDLMRLIGDELSLPRRHRAENHLAACPRCHARYEKLHRPAHMVDAYCEDLAESYISRRSAQRDLLLVRLNRFFRDAASRPLQVQCKKKNLRITFPTMNPTFATAMVLAFASVVCIFVWLQQAKPGITSNTLLVRAEAWDATSSSPSAGVIRQRVGIKTPKHRIYRTIYRDAHGQRQSKFQKLAFDDEQLKNTLAAAGVAWDAPLSATAYQDWHDRQRVRRDQIQSSGGKLVLTTTVPDGLIAEQSFTVRDSDFHPVERTVIFRDSGTIEIAELEYQVLPWAEVDGNLFEPAGLARAEAPIVLQPSLVPRLPAVPTEAQLDEAELSARLVLDQLQADTGEQIQVEHDAQAIQVKGLVETDRRKMELLGQLHTLPHVEAAILSMEELSRRPSRVGGTGDQQTISAAAESSPLENYFLSQSRTVVTVSDLSQQLVDSALTVDQESRAMTDLLARFGPTTKMTDLASATLSELVFSHRDRLLRALKQEQELLSKAGGVSGVQSSAATVDKSGSLVDASGRNLALCKELTLGGSPSRSAESILADLNASVEEVRARARATKLMSQSAPAAAGIK